MNNLYNVRPVILCGGIGSRLWPISSQNYPKQFIEFKNNKSLFEITLKRAVKIKNAIKPTIITNINYKFIIEKILKKADIQANLLLEPDGKGTTAAFYLSSKLAQENDLNLYLPSDHYIDDEKLFLQILNCSMENFYTDNWITYGIQPTFPHDGFGYIEIKKSLKKIKKYEFSEVKSFTEKPSIIKAKKMLKSQNYFWNSGIFLATRELIQKTIKLNEPDIAKKCDIVWEKKIKNNNYFMFDDRLYNNIRTETIDYTLMKSSNAISMWKLNVGWNDIGSWDNFFKSYKPQNNKDKVFNIGGSDNYIYPTSKIMATIDVNDLIIIDSPDSLLISKKGSSEKIKSLVKKINKKNETNIKLVFKPWGFYEILLDSEVTKVKRLNIYPDTRLSYQYHNFRNEHWVIISGSAEVKLNGKIKKLEQNENIYIPQKAKHYIKNISKQNLILIEIQTGTYFGEDDIIRIDDPFKR